MNTNTTIVDEVRVSVDLDNEDKTFKVSLNSAMDFFGTGDNLNSATDDFVNRLVMAVYNNDTSLVPQEIIDEVAWILNIDSSGSTGPLYNMLKYFYTPVAYTTVNNDLLKLRQYIEAETDFDILCVEHLLDDVEGLAISIQVRELCNWLKCEALDCAHPDDIEDIIEMWATAECDDIAGDDDDEDEIIEGYSIIYTNQEENEDYE